MFEKEINEALEKLANDKESVEAFLEGFTKVAVEREGPGFFTRPFTSGGGTESIHSGILKGLTGALGKGMGELAIGMGATGIGSAYAALKDTNLHNKFLQALERAVQGNPILKQASKAKVLGYGETVFKFAPNVATDSNLLSAILANAVHGEGIDPMTIKTLTDLESKFKSNNTFSPKTYV